MIKKIIVFVLCLTFILTPVLSSISIAAEQTYSYIYGPCVSNLDPNKDDVCLIVNGNNEFYITDKDASRFSGWKATSNKDSVVFKRGSETYTCSNVIKYDLWWNASVSSDIWVPLNETMDQLNVAVSLLDKILVFDGVAVTIPELINLMNGTVFGTDELNYGFSTNYTFDFDDSDTKRLLGWGAMWDSIIKLKWIDRLAGKANKSITNVDSYSIATYEKVLYNALSVEQESFYAKAIEKMKDHSGLIKTWGDHSKNAKNISQLATVLASKKLDVEITKDICKTLTTDESGKYAQTWAKKFATVSIGFSDIGKMTDPVGTSLKDKNISLFDMKISGLDIGTQLGLIMNYYKAIGASEDSMNSIIMTFYYNNDLVAEISKCPECLDTIAGLEAYYTSKKFSDNLRNFAMQEVKTILAKTLEKSATEAIETKALGFEKDLIATIVMGATDTAFKHLPVLKDYKTDETLDFTKRLPVIINLQDVAKAQYDKYIKAYNEGTKDAIFNAKYAAMLYCNLFEQAITGAASADMCDTNLVGRAMAVYNVLASTENSKLFRVVKGNNIKPQDIDADFPTPTQSSETQIPTETAAPTTPAKPTSSDSYYTRSGDYIYFGSYPQSEVTDETIKSKLSAIAGSTSNWTSYGYYIENKVSDFMKYKDVTYNGNKYRGVYFTQYRPSYTGGSSSSKYTVQDDNDYYTNTIYWFKYEPIKWKILSESNGDAFLVTDMLLDSQDYNHTDDNNYANSSIRSWLNSTFYNTAFNSTEQGKIKTTNVDNSVASTGDSSNPNVCSDTNDKIFLLSYKEATNSSYGFSSSSGSTSTREKYLTAYAKVQGAGSSSGHWGWLRSPYSIMSDYARAITNDGSDCYGYVGSTCGSIAAALHLTLDTNSQNQSAKSTAKSSTPKVTVKPTAKPTPTPTSKPSSGSYYTRSGNYIYFGSYPQSEVTDSSLKSSLTSAAGSTSNWTSYNYYIEGKVSDFMKYKDVTYNGNKYRGVYFTQYRPYYAECSSSSSYSNQNVNGYYKNTFYWFKYEPIKWKILEESNGDAFLVADMLLDSQDYNHTLNNNYANSSIRSWLNSTFYNTAFNSTEQGKIKTTKVDNSAASTRDSSNPYACSDTNDKIFLLSYKEATNDDYGFNSDGYSDDSSKVKNPTAYAKVQGVVESDSGGWWWWLRSPYDYSSDDARTVNYDGNAYYDRSSVFNTSNGVAAALHLTLS